WRSAKAICMLRIRSISTPAIVFVGTGIFTLTSSALVPVELSTVTDFVIGPLLPARLTVTLIGPLVPGASFHGCDGNCATVQPQEVWTLLMRTTSLETFVR